MQRRNLQKKVSKRIVLAVIAVAILMTFCVEANALNVWIQHDNEAPYHHYSVGGTAVDFEITMYLQEKLAQAGIEWWMPYAVCQLFQESSGDPYQKTSYGSGCDCGLFQIRDIYFGEYLTRTGAEGDIMDYRTQVNIYVSLVADRIASGATVEKVISDWTTGGYTDRICQTYVDDVLSWMNKIEEN